MAPTGRGRPKRSQKLPTSCEHEWRFWRMRTGADSDERICLKCGRLARAGTVWEKVEKAERDAKYWKDKSNAAK